MGPTQCPFAVVKFLWLAVFTLGGLFMLVYGLDQAQAESQGYSRQLPAVYARWPAPTPTPSPGRALISEVLYNPAGAEPEGEWVELYNAGGLPVDLGGYKLGDAAAPGDHEGMYRLPDGVVLLPGHTVVIANHAVHYEFIYGFLPDFELVETDPGVPTLEKYSAWAAWTMQLAEEGDEVLLMDPGDRWVDALSWGSSLVAFYPPAPRVEDGASLERVPADQDTDSAFDWREQPVPAPGQVLIPTPTPTATPTFTPTAAPTFTAMPDYTPTATHTATPTITPLPILVINEIQADPDPVLGDANGDGVVHLFDDELVEIANMTGSAIDLSGWRIVTAFGARHTFPSGSLLANGCAVVVFGGGNPSGDFGGSLVQTASSGGFYLDNAGGPVRLENASGDQMLAYSYGIEAGNDQSITRSPDIFGPDPLVLHSGVPAAAGALFSPGRQLDGQPFSGCAPPDR